jgi:hypothetical protein
MNAIEAANRMRRAMLSVDHAKEARADGAAVEAASYTLQALSEVVVVLSARFEAEKNLASASGRMVRGPAWAPNRRRSLGDLFSAALDPPETRPARSWDLETPVSTVRPLGGPEVEWAEVARSASASGTTLADAVRAFLGPAGGPSKALPKTKAGRSLTPLREALYRFERGGVLPPPLNPPRRAPRKSK